MDGEAIQELDRHQKGVNIAKAVGNAECVIGSTLGTIGGALLFSPLAPVGVIVGLVGLGVGMKGLVIETGASIANYVIGKNTIKDFDEDMKVALINREVVTKLWERIFNLAKKKNISVQQKEILAKDFISEVEEWDIRPYAKQREKYITIKTRRNIKWYQFLRNEEKEKRRQKMVIDILDFISKYWLKKKMKTYNVQHVESTCRKAPDIPQEIDNAEVLVAIKAAKGAKKIAKHIHKIVDNSIRLAASGVNIIDDVATAAPSVTSLAAQSMDELGTAATGALSTVKSIGTLTKVAGVVGGSIGVSVAGISLGKNIKSLINGSESEKVEAILMLTKQIDVAFEIKENVLDTLRRNGIELANNNQ